MRNTIQAVALAASFCATTALAHVTVDPKQAPAGSYAKLTFRVPHGCGGSPTTAVQVRIPAGVTSVKPQVHPGWTIKIEKEALPKPVKDGHGNEVGDVIKSVTWTGGPLPDEFMDEFGVSVKLPSSSKGPVPFVVNQTCEKGEARWGEDADSGLAVTLR
jgi:uncharacterized protein YcnI